MWSAFRAFAERIGLSAEKVAEVEREEGVSRIQDPLRSEVSYMVRPDPDWTARIGEAWKKTLVNSRRETAGAIQVPEGLLSVTEADIPESGITVTVAPGRYDVMFTVAHLGSAETYDYEEHISHAFVLLDSDREVSLIEPLTDEDGIELSIDAYSVAFSPAGVLPEIAGDHPGRWTLRISDLMHPKLPERAPTSLKSIKIESDDKTGAAIILYGGHGRGNYPVFRMADANGNNIGVMIDFFVDNRPW